MMGDEEYSYHEESEDRAKAEEKHWRDQVDLFGTEAHKLARSTDPATSHAASRRVDTTRLEKMVYEFIATAGPGGVIAADILDAFPRTPYPSITARFSALERKELIVCGPDKRVGPSGRNQRVMRAKEAEND